jgi:charged multivesicular body protein 5
VKELESICLCWFLYECVFETNDRFDNQADSMRSQSFNMEQATMALQTAKDTQVVVAGMKAGVQQMKKEFKKIDVDKIEV